MTSSAVKIAFPDVPIETKNNIYSNVGHHEDLNKFNMIGGAPWALTETDSTELIQSYEFDTGNDNPTTVIDHFIAQRYDLQSAQVRLGASPASRNEIADISGLVLWLDSSTGVTTDANNLVSAWADRSVSALSAAQSTAGNRPLYTRADDLGNFLTYSNEFDNADWTATGASVTADADFNPVNGAEDVDLLIEDGSTGAHSVNQTTSTWVIKSKNYRFSFYAAPDTRSIVAGAILGTAFSSIPFAAFNVSTGAVAASSNCVASIELAGTSSNGNIYYRCTMTMNADADGDADCYIGLHNGTTTIYTGTAGLQAYIFGAQFNETADAATYLPTTNLGEMSGVNGFPAIFFNDQVPDYLDLGNPSALQITGDITVFAAVRQSRLIDGAKDYHIYDNLTSSASGSALVIKGPNLKPEYRTATSGSNSMLAANTAVTLDTAYVLSFVKSGTTGTHYRNSTSDGSGTIAHPTTPTAGTKISSSSSSIAFCGKICEVLVFNAALSTDDRTTIEGYLQAKYTDTPISLLNVLEQQAIGINSTDYVDTTASYSGTDRYFWIDIYNTSGDVQKHGKFFFGEAFDFGTRVANYRAELIIDQRNQFDSTSGELKGVRVDLPRYRFTIEYDDVTDDKVTEFINSVVAISNKTGFFLYTTENHEILDEKQIVYCKLVDWNTQQNGDKIDYNSVVCVFEEYVD